MRTRLKVPTRLVALVAALSLLVAACGGDEEPDEPGGTETSGTSEPSDGDETEEQTESAEEGEVTYASGQTVSIRMPDEWRDFDFHQTFEGNTHAILMNAYATLLHQNADGTLTGYLATDYEMTPTSITFDIRDDATCPDGTALTPSIVRDSTQRMIDLEGNYNALLWGPGPYTLTADDGAGTFTFATETPHSHLDYAFSNRFPGTSTAIICPSGLADGADLTTEMHGFGPYVLDQVAPGDRLTMTLRDDFTWGPDGMTAQDPGVPAELVYRVVSNATTAANLLLTGELNAATVSGADVERLREEDALTWKRNTREVVLPITFNHGEGRVTADKTLRQALITALDPQEMLQAALRGEGEWGPSIFHEDVACFDPSVADLVPEPSIEAARAVLEESPEYDTSTTPITRDGEPVTVVVHLDQALNPMPEYIQDVWTELGVEVDLRVTDYQEYVTALIQGTFDVSAVTTSSYGPIPDPIAGRFSGPFFEEGGTNYARIRDERNDEIAAQALASSGEEACDLWAEFQQRMWTEWHVLPYGAPYDYSFANGVDLSLVRGGGERLGFMLRAVEQS